jgi:low molecular weight protein-tyrosine phosphatase
MRILFFCMGNICRSPVVEVVARERFERAGLDIEVASAGTENYHIGERADPRAVASARTAGYDLSRHRARQLSAADFAEFDWLLAMDRVNLRAAKALCAVEHACKLDLFLTRAAVTDELEVPDPYYGGPGDFRRVIELAEIGAEGLIARLRQAHNRHPMPAKSKP